MAVGNLEFIKSATGSSVSSLSVTDCFSADYDVYYINFVDLDTSITENLIARFIDSGGSVISDSEYDYATLLMRSYSAFGEEKATGTTFIGYFSYDEQNAGTGTSMYVYNPNDSSSYTFSMWQNSSGSSVGMLGRKGISVHKSAEQITGINFLPASGTLTKLTVNVYGLASN